ncbi:DNA-binding protein YbiB [Rosenbergiella australiborealis]|uniref:DNA-binding protein YbiB n=1 Tax=Rosenbergiella australiborealis TaxID=1544696 RepID=A0ABS5T3R9_9GAMM|nr:DNA-binding protein YbiB [Rosenbergiella australiborealis]MBT0726998.1 DNA-binding protein YbiB [Rosenbergiella australiborealis]
MDIKQIIKEIGRGKLHARHLDQDNATFLYRAILADEVDDLSLGAILIALRIKGEGEEELLGFYRALEAFLPQWAGLTHTLIIPSYNGARRQANVTPLLALLLKKLGVKVFLHGIHHDLTRVTTAEILAAMGIFPAQDHQQAYQQIVDNGFTFMTIDKLCPPLAKQLDLRWHLGLRNSAHTLAKLISPFTADSGVRLTSVSHPEYLPKVTQFFLDIQAKALVSNGCEGEVYLNPLRPSAIQYVDNEKNTITEIVSRGLPAQTPLAENKEIATTVTWTQDVLDQKCPVPLPLREQIIGCLVACGRMTSLAEARTWLTEQGY